MFRKGKSLLQSSAVGVPLAARLVGDVNFMSTKGDCVRTTVMVMVCGVCLQVKLLKDVLEEWKKEVDKKPPEMSIDQAYEALGLKTGVGG